MKTVIRATVRPGHGALYRGLAAVAACGFAFASAARADDDNGSSDRNPWPAHPTMGIGRNALRICAASPCATSISRAAPSASSGATGATTVAACGWMKDVARRSSFDSYRGGDHPRTYGDRDRATTRSDELRVKCESQDGHRNNCDVNLRGYRIADVQGDEPGGLRYRPQLRLRQPRRLGG